MIAIRLYSVLYMINTNQTTAVSSAESRLGAFLVALSAWKEVSNQAFSLATWELRPTLRKDDARDSRYKNYFHLDKVLNENLQRMEIEYTTFVWV